MHNPVVISKAFHPVFYDGPDVNKIMVPIQPQYYIRLFPEVPGRNLTIDEAAGQFIVEGNTIKKAYLCRAKIKAVQPGDVILLYRSKDLRGVATLGVIEEFHTNITNLDDAIKIVGKRTVYTKDEISDMLQRPITIFLFRYHVHLNTPVSFALMKEHDILNGPPQSIMLISDEKYMRFKKVAGLDERFTVN